MTDHFDDVGAYLLGALSPDEVAAFERAMAADEELRAEVDHLRVAAEALPASPIQMAPPADLKARVMAEVNREAELFRAAEKRPEPSKPRRRVVAVLRPGWWSLRPGVAVAASVLVLAIGAALGGVLLGGGSDQRIVATLGNAKLIERSSGHSTLTATKMRPASAGHVYQVWLQRKGGKPKPTNALFGARRDGTASVDVPGSLDDVDTVLVTEEPEGGSREPTTPAIIKVHPA